MSSRTVHIHIDRMVVQGLPAHAQQRFVRALEKQLAQMVEAQAPHGFASGGSRRISSFDAGRLPRGASPEQAARQITAALHGQLAGKENRHA